jgi:hypothetical protein
MHTGTRDVVKVAFIDSLHSQQQLSSVSSTRHVVHVQQQAVMLLILLACTILEGAQASQHLMKDAQSKSYTTVRLRSGRVLPRRFPAVSVQDKIPGAGLALPLSAKRLK